MRQFDVYETPGASARVAPFVLILQSHFLDALPSVLVAPLLRSGERPAYKEVSVTLPFEGESFVISPAEMVAMDRRRLTQHRGDLRQYEDQIRRALERVFTGF